jgi:hypothetical protein
MTTGAPRTVGELVRPLPGCPRARVNAVNGAPDPIVALLREHTALLERICRALEHQSRPSHLTRGDRDRLAAILPAAGGVFGSELFITRDLFASEAAALRLVLRGLNCEAGRPSVPPGGRARRRRLSDSAATAQS